MSQGGELCTNRSLQDSGLGTGLGANFGVGVLCAAVSVLLVASSLLSAPGFEGKGLGWRLGDPSLLQAGVDWGREGRKRDKVLGPA